MSFPRMRESSFEVLSSLDSPMRGNNTIIAELLFPQPCFIWSW